MAAVRALLPALCLGCTLILARPVRAQPPTLPHARLWTLAPSGGQAGTTTRVTLSGVDLEESRELRFSQTGVTARPAQDPKKPGAVLPLQFDVQIATAATPGRCDVRVVGRYGISNPRVFIVGDLPEIAETEPNNDLPQAQPLPINTVLNGATAAPADVDFFKVEGHAGQTLVVHCAAESIDSRLDPEIQVYDAAGRRLASNRRYQGRAAEVAFRPLATGVFYLRLSQHAYQSGDAHHFYRLTATTRPWAVAACPAVLARGTDDLVTLLGYNLADGHAVAETVQIEPLQRLMMPLRVAHPSGRARPSCAAGRMLGLDFTDERPSGVANSLSFLESARPTVAASATAENSSSPQPVAPPATVYGRLGQSGRQHWFRFTAKKDAVLIAEAFGDRLGSNLDLYLELRRADTGQLLAEFDDPLDALQALRFFARTEDPKARLVIPADGDYLLSIGSRGRSAGSAAGYPYVLCVRPEEPDFRLVAVGSHPQSPGAWQLARGSRRFIEVFVQRKEGFSGPVTLTAIGLPPGVTTVPQVIPAGAMQTQFVVSIAPDAPDFIGPIGLAGEALHNGAKIQRNVEAGCMIWPNPGEPNGVPAWSRLCHEISAAVREAPPFTVQTSVETVSATPGGTIPLAVRLNRLTADAGVPLSIVPLVLPPGAVFNGNNAPVPVQPGQSETSVAVMLPANAAAGPCQITLAAVGQIPFTKDAKLPKSPVTVTEAAKPIGVEIYALPAEVKLAPATAPAPAK